MHGGVVRRRKRRSQHFSSATVSGISSQRAISPGVWCVEVQRGPNGFGFTISGQQPCLLSCIVAGSPAEYAGLRPGQALLAVNGKSVARLPHDTVVRLIGGCVGLLRLQVCENYYPASSDSDVEDVDGYLHRRPVQGRAARVVRDLQSGAMFIEKVALSPQRPVVSPPLQLPPRGAQNPPPPPPPSRIQPTDFRAVVGYLGTIELPKELRPGSRLAVIKSCVRRMRTEQRVHTIVTLVVCKELCVLLVDSQSNVLAEFPSERVAFCGACADDKRFFGLVTSVSSGGDEGEDDDDSACGGSSCHVFMVDPSQHPHHEHALRASDLRITCTPVGTGCAEFPAQADPILRAVAALYAPPPPPPPPPPRSNTSSCHSSNSDSGIGFREEVLQGEDVHLHHLQAGCNGVVKEDRLSVRAMPDPPPVITVHQQPPCRPSTKPCVPSSTSLDDLPSSSTLVCGASSWKHQDGDSTSTSVEQPYRWGSLQDLRSSTSDGAHSSRHRRVGNMSGFEQVSTHPQQPAALSGLKCCSMMPPPPPRLQKDSGSSLLLHSQLPLPCDEETDFGLPLKRWCSDSYFLNQHPPPGMQPPITPVAPRRTLEWQRAVAPKNSPRRLQAGGLPRSPRSIYSSAAQAGSPVRYQKTPLRAFSPRRLKSPRRVSLLLKGLHYLDLSYVESPNSTTRTPARRNVGSILGTPLLSSTLSQEITTWEEHETPVGPRQPAAAFSNVFDLSHVNVTSILTPEPLPKNKILDSALQTALLPNSTPSPEATILESKTLTGKFPGTAFSSNNLFRKASESSVAQLKKLPLLSDEQESMISEVMGLFSSPVKASQATLRPITPAKDPPENGEKMEVSPLRAPVLAMAEVCELSLEETVEEMDIGTPPQVLLKTRLSFIMETAEDLEIISTPVSEEGTKSEVQSHKVDAQSWSQSEGGSEADVHSSRATNSCLDSFERLLDDPNGMHAFAEFLKKEFSHENIYFWVACERYRKLSDASARKSQARAIFQRHLAAGAPEPVNVDSQARQATKEGLDVAKPDLFISAQKQIFNLMKFDSFPRFTKCSSYREAMEASMSLTELDPDLLLHHDGANPGKLKKSRSDADERRRKSLLPWNRNKPSARSKSRERSDATPVEVDSSSVRSCSELTGSRSSLASSDLVLMHRGSTSRQSLSSSDSVSAGELCRVILPDSATTVLQTQAGETTKKLIQQLLEKRGIQYSSFEVFLHDTNKAVVLSDDSTVLNNKEVRVEQRVVFRLDLPSGKTVGVKAKAGRTLAEVLRPILHKYGHRLENTSVSLMYDTEHLDPGLPITSVENQRLQASVTGAENWQSSAAHERHSSGARLDEITNRVFEELLQCKADGIEGPVNQHHESLSDQGSLRSKDWSSEHSSSGIFGRFLRRDSAFDRKRESRSKGKKGAPSQHQQHLSLELDPRLVPGIASFKIPGASCPQQSPSVAKWKLKPQQAHGRSDSDELYEGLKRAQRCRLEDQRGTEINFELPDFLKPGDCNNTQSWRLKKGRLMEGDAVPLLAAGGVDLSPSEKVMLPNEARDSTGLSADTLEAYSVPHCAPTSLRCTLTSTPPVPPLRYIAQPPPLPPKPKALVPSKWVPNNGPEEQEQQTTSLV